MAENFTSRPKRSKTELKQAFGNVGRKLNEMIEAQLGAGNDWRDILKRDRPALSNEEWERCLQPE